ncbi:hypothetical protein ACNAN0_10130 [Agrilactobacillus fermenti]|uniref:hypothetical protein n=1 Tax=Agrilactobacillus fermenti TaxID=2586909 RepID=UPI003A5C556D
MNNAVFLLIIVSVGLLLVGYIIFIFYAIFSSFNKIQHKLKSDIYNRDTDSAMKRKAVQLQEQELRENLKLKRQQEQITRHRLNNLNTSNSADQPDLDRWFNDN